MTNLGRLQKVLLRDIWATEAQDFTPWLAGEENLLLLSETLGLELELEAVEQNVGPFRADILCKDTGSDTWVLIENQLERTDHTHLGQLITYAAGLDAVTIVWIAARIADEHRAAIDWLNETTRDDVRFFALEVELWCIGDSPAAPKFNVVSKPNDWSRSTATARKAIAETAMTPTREMQQDYWEAVQSALALRKNGISRIKALPQSWLTHGIGRSSVALGMSMNTRENLVRVEIYLSGDRAKGYFWALHDQKAEIEDAIGQALNWQSLEHRNDSRIALHLEQTDPSRREDWPRKHAWLLDTLETFNRTFRPRIAKIDPEMAQILS